MIVINNVVNVYFELMIIIKKRVKKGYNLMTIFNDEFMQFILMTISNLTFYNTFIDYIYTFLVVQ